jgi:hypothetical protein
VLRQLFLLSWTILKAWFLSRQFLGDDLVRSFRLGLCFESSTGGTRDREESEREKQKAEK